jgi:hypothetical protein
VQLSPVDAGGNFELSGLGDGTYRLFLETSGTWRAANVATFTVREGTPDPVLVALAVADDPAERSPARASNRARKAEEPKGTLVVERGKGATGRVEILVNGEPCGTSRCRKSLGKGDAWIKCIAPETPGSPTNQVVRIMPPGKTTVRCFP